MSDNWSLKGKGFIIKTLAPLPVVYEKDMKNQEDKSIFQFLYTENDIETLRQKIIEDIEKYNDFELTNEDIKQIINKRFGVEFFEPTKWGDEK